MNDIDVVIAKDQIRDVLYRYCTALDRLDVEMLKSVYHPDGYDDHGDYSAPAHEFAEMIVALIRESTTSGFHTVTHSAIRVADARAVAESYYFGIHLIGPGREKIEAFFGPSYAEEQARTGSLHQSHEHLAGGRYIDELEKRDGAWRILRRRLTNEWGRNRPVGVSRTEGVPGKFDMPGRRDLSDMVYSLESFLQGNSVD